MSKNALVYFHIPTEDTKSDFVKNDYDEIVKYSVPTFEDYCFKYGIDLIKIDVKKYGFQQRDWYNYQMYEKNQVYGLFDNYDRILRIDADFLIRSCSPNIFDVVDENKIGAVYEDKYFKVNDRSNHIKRASRILGLSDMWDINSGYVNAGMVVASKMHRDIFELKDTDIHFILTQQGDDDKYEPETLYKYENGRPVFTEQTYFNSKIVMSDHEVQPLSYMFNHSVFFKKELLEYTSSNIRRKYTDSYFLHYSAYSNRIEQMRKDYNLIVSGEWRKERLMNSMYRKYGDRKELKKKNTKDLMRIFKNFNPQAASADSIVLNISFEEAEKLRKHLCGYIVLQFEVVIIGNNSVVIKFEDKFVARSLIEAVDETMFDVLLHPKRKQ